MFRVSHEAADTLRAMGPVIDRLQCDASEGYTTNESTPTNVVAADASVSRSLDERGKGRGLLQFLNPFARARAFSDEREVSEFFERLAAPEEETGATPDESVPNQFGTDDLGGRYGLPLDTGGDAYADDDEDAAEVAVDAKPFVPGDNDAVGASAACEDEVGRLANDVQWWSRGAGPLEPGLPNEPYDEYVFAGSVDVLAENERRRRTERRRLRR
jgi:hypothetical protein